MISDEMWQVKMKTMTEISLLGKEKSQTARAAAAESTAKSKGSERERIELLNLPN